MPALPAITFLGLRGVAAWAALGAAGAGAYVVATRALPALGRGGGGGAGVPARSTAEPTAELLVNLLRSASDASARVATSALGPGASLGVAGIGVARDVTGALERFAETQTRAIADTSRELVRSQTEATRAILQYANRQMATIPTAPATSAPATVAQAATSAPAAATPAPAAAPVAVVVPAAPAAETIGRAPTGVPTAPAAVVSSVDSALRARGVSVEQARAMVNIPALARAPGVKWTAADEAAVAAGRVPFAISSDGTVSYR